MSKNDKFVDYSDAHFMAPPHKTRFEAFRDFLYNSDEGSCLGRTPASWAKITLFYIIFYACLAGFWAVCLWGLMQTIDPDTPTYILDRSLIGPGVASRPMPPEGRESVLVYNRESQSWSNAEWLHTLDEFLNDYQAEATNTQVCNYETTREEGKVCVVNPEDWQECKPNGTVENICMFFKLNKLFEWVPDYYKDLESLPAGMPQDLKDVIQDEFAKHPERKNKVWLSCVGREEVDQQRLGRVIFRPEPAFPGYYYPFRNQEGFRSPVVALYIVDPQIDQEINLECRTWAHNMEQDRREQIGVLNFKIRIQ